MVKVGQNEDKIDNTKIIINLSAELKLRFYEKIALDDCYTTTE